jgi:uncharacterized protein YbaR (Trm112 family)/ubiquinone/menaquinone biosynthesis C-methylase UbiE
VAITGINPTLLELLACPACRGELTDSDGQLSCAGCGRHYPLDGGIPALLPDTCDEEHLREEESLARKMQAREALPEMRFNLDQWDRSKVDFWNMVRSRITGRAKRIANLGCGYDPNFASLIAEGHVFVNFDIVQDMLQRLQARYPLGHYVNGDLGSLPFRPGAFDYLVSIDVIHHECENLPRVFASFRDLLKPGGTLFLEDPNAWGMFQMAKSIFMPRPVYRYLRSFYHRLRRTEHRPADYEFPTNVWKVKRLLQDAGFEQIRFYPQNAYPTISPTSHRIYSWFSGSEYVRTFHNYHYMLSGVRS